MYESVILSVQRLVWIACICHSLMPCVLTVLRDDKTLHPLGFFFPPLSLKQHFTSVSDRSMRSWERQTFIILHRIMLHGLKVKTWCLLILYISYKNLKCGATKMCREITFQCWNSTRNQMEFTGYQIFKWFFFLLSAECLS